MLWTGRSRPCAGRRRRPERSSVLQRPCGTPGPPDQVRRRRLFVWGTAVSPASLHNIRPHSGLTRVSSLPRPRGIPGPPDQVRRRRRFVWGTAASPASLHNTRPHSGLTRVSSLPRPRGAPGPPDQVRRRRRFVWGACVSCVSSQHQASLGLDPSVQSPTSARHPGAAGSSPAATSVLVVAPVLGASPHHPTPHSGLVRKPTRSRPRGTSRLQDQMFLGDDEVEPVAVDEVGLVSDGFLVGGALG